jgi:hypothetical protein
VTTCFARVFPLITVAILPYVTSSATRLPGCSELDKRKHVLDEQVWEPHDPVFTHARFRPHGSNEVLTTMDWVVVKPPNSPTSTVNSVPAVTGSVTGFPPRSLPETQHTETSG